MSTTDSDNDRARGAQPGNRNAAKPEDQKIAGKGRIVADFGELKAQCVRAAQARGMKLVPWLREAAEEKLEREK